MKYIADKEVDKRASLVVDLLANKGWTISFAESCTAGLAAAHLVDVPSASNILESSFVTYSDKAKIELCWVSESTIKKRGVVSEDVAVQMAIGIAHVNRANIGVGISGYAGPTGGTQEAPVGTVCFGFYVNGKTMSATKHFGNIGRDGVRIASVNYVYDYLASMLQKIISTDSE